MKLNLRVSLVWLCLSAFLALFLSGESGILDFAARIQVLPAFLRWSPSILFFAGMALLAGRFYCSLLCPLGLFQDCVRTFSRRPLPGYRKGPVLRYWVLAATTVSLLTGSLILARLLDPFSNFGRGATQLVRPLLVLTNNLLALLPLPRESVGVFRSLPPPPVFPPSAFAAAVFLGLLAAWSVFRGRPYCDTLCPVGTFLGLFSSKPVLAVRFTGNPCTGCGNCEKACPVGCLSAKERKIDGDRCVLCLDCIGACPGGGLALGILSRGEQLERRALLRSGIGLGTGLALLFSPTARSLGRIAGKETTGEPPISPPGSISHSHFSSLCVACSSCVKACPAGIIRPSFSAWGPWGIFQPHLDYEHGYCQYECTACTASCPTGAIEPLSREDKKRVQIGLSHFRQGNCIVVKKGTSCGACAEHCPTHAAHMVPFRDGLAIPQVDVSLCIGCGACQFACPASPKAMTVLGLASHGRAKLATELEEGPILAPLEEFPF